MSGEMLEVKYTYSHAGFLGPLSISKRNSNLPLAILKAALFQHFSPPLVFGLVGGHSAVETSLNGHVP